jgi:ABC-type phosphonate transport system ATPase subunit
VQIEANVQSGSWGASHSPHDELVAQLTAAAHSGERALAALESEYGRNVAAFMQRKAEARHLDLRFLTVQVTFSDYFAGA